MGINPSGPLFLLWGLYSILNPRKDYQSPLPQRFPTALVSFTPCEIPFHDSSLDQAALENHNHPPHDDTHTLVEIPLPF